MTVMLAEVYDALREIGVTDATARRAATAPATSEPRFGELGSLIATSEQRVRAEIAELGIRLRAEIIAGGGSLRSELRLLKRQIGLMWAILLPVFLMVLRVAAKLGMLWP